MKKIFLFVAVTFLFGCATKSDVEKIQSQIDVVKLVDEEIDKNLTQTESVTTSADNQFTSAIYYNTRALDSLELASEKLNKIAKRR